MHLALATERPDAQLAARVAAAASRAAARGVRPQAVVLAEHALRLTPEDAPDRHDRLLTAGGYLSLAGERQRMTDLLAPALTSLPSGRQRARAWLLLSDANDVTTLQEYQRRLDCALAEDDVEAAVRAHALAEKTTATAVVAVRRIPEAETWAREALAIAQGEGAVIERRLLYSLSWASALHGRPVDELCARFGAVSPESAFLVASPEQGRRPTTRVARPTWGRPRRAHAAAPAGRRPR